MSDRFSPSRRAFLGVAAPMIVPRSVLGGTAGPAPSDRIRVGVIGVGGRSNLLIDQIPAPGEIVALADCDLERCETANAKRKKNWDVYQDYRRLLDRKDIDGVIVGTPDHVRVLPCFHAAMAGKDIYAEKPLTLYIGEGRALVNAIRKYKRICQVGTQQRSMEMDQIACRLVREGGLGKLKTVQIYNYPSSKPAPELTPEPVPQKLNWDMWLSQTPMRGYHSRLRRGWMSWNCFAGGELTNWGAHGLDMVQCALGADLTGPVELWPMLDAGPRGAVAFRYASGVEVQMVLPGPTDLMGGGRFICEKGKIDIWRNNFKIDPPDVKVDLPPAEDIEKWHDKRALWQAQYHMGYWLEAMKTRKTPNADVEIGHRSVSVSHLITITRILNRKVRWDPKKEEFPGDAEANALVNRPRRAGYELPKG
jgi:predicted dehydrogenase